MSPLLPLCLLRLFFFGFFSLSRRLRGFSCETKTDSPWREYVPIVSCFVCVCVLLACVVFWLTSCMRSPMSRLLGHGRATTYYSSRKRTCRWPSNGRRNGRQACLALRVRILVIVLSLACAVLVWPSLSVKLFLTTTGQGVYLCFVVISYYCTHPCMCLSVHIRLLYV